MLTNPSSPNLMGGKKPSDRIFEIYLGLDKKDKQVFAHGQPITISAVEEAIIMYLNENSPSPSLEKKP